MQKKKKKKKKANYLLLPKNVNTIIKDFKHSKNRARTNHNNY